MADPSATPLSNADFRALLATPRADRSGSSTPSGFARPAGNKGPRDVKKDQADKAKKPYRPKPKPKEENEGEDDEDKNTYR